VGINDGCSFDGSIDGDLVGSLEGFSVIMDGSMDGDKVGSFEGLSVGILLVVGLKDGDHVGNEVRDGELDGGWDGSTVKS